MHVCHGIFRLGFEHYLKPIADQVGYTILTRDFQLKKWNKHDEFLLLFIEASVQWLYGIDLLTNYVMFDMIFIRYCTTTLQKPFNFSIERIITQ